MAKRKKHGGAALNQALLESDVKYSPAAFALSQLLRDAHSTYLTQIQGERASAAGISKAAKAAIPGMRKVYGTAQNTRQAATDLVTPKIANLAGSDDIRAALAAENASQQGRIAEAGASAESELRNRSVDAVVAGKRGEQAARTQYATDKGRIGQQLLDLASQKGAFTAATLGSIKQAQRQARVTLRGQTLSHKDRQASLGETKRHNQVQESKPAKGSKRSNRVTVPNQAKALDQIRIATQTIKQLNGKVPSTTLRQLLTTGYTTPKKKDKNGKTVGGNKIPQIKTSGAIDAHTIINAAFDIATYGTLSRPNRVALRGVHLPAQWKRPVRKKQNFGQAAQSAANAVAGIVR